MEHILKYFYIFPKRLTCVSLCLSSIFKECLHGYFVYRVKWFSLAPQCSVIAVNTFVFLFLLFPWWCSEHFCDVGGLLWPAFIPPPLSSVIKMEEGGKMIRVLPIICCTSSLRAFPNKMWESIHCFRTFTETSEGKKSFFGEFALYLLCVQQKKTTKEGEDGIRKTQCESILAEAAEK